MATIILDADGNKNSSDSIIVCIQGKYVELCDLCIAGMHQEMPVSFNDRMVTNISLVSRDMRILENPSFVLRKAAMANSNASSYGNTEAHYIDDFSDDPKAEKIEEVPQRVKTTQRKNFFEEPIYENINDEVDWNS